MRERLNAEGHDESQYLPRDTPPVNPYRAQHKGIKWKGTSIVTSDWLPDELFERGLIEKLHLDTATDLFKAWVLTKQELGVSDINGILSDGIEIDGIKRSPKDIFFHVMTKLRKRESAIVLWLIEQKNTLANISISVKLIGNIHHALENTKNIIDSLQKSVNIQKDVPPELSQNFAAQP